MERCPSQFSVTFLVAAATQSFKFRRVVSLIGVILIISTQFFTVSALNESSSTETTNLDNIKSDNRRRSGVDVVVNATGELGASSNKIVREDVEAVLHRHHHHHHPHHRRRFQTSSYVRASLLRSQQHQYQQTQKKDVGNLRKLSSNSGCLTDPTMCMSVAGWTTESFASTCCHNGWCTDIHFDGLNCGGCGNPCKFGYFCCSGFCVAIESDSRNCGRCGNVCQGGTCAFGLCGYSAMDFVINSTDSR